VLIDAASSVAGSLTASPFHFLESNSFAGNFSIKDVNYNLSIAGKLGDHVSIGGSLILADFSIQSEIGALQKNEQNFGDHFVSVYDTSSQEIGFNAGVLVHATSQISIGAVYKYQPNFDLKTVVNNNDANPPTQLIENIGFDIPDSLGIGISVAPSHEFTFNFDVVRVYYSQFEDVQAGFSLFTHLLPFSTDQLVFKINDGTDIHLGGEYLFNAKNAVFALRGGYYRESRNRFFFGSAPAAEDFLAPIFGTEAADPLNHFTFGTGFTYGVFQLDFAADYTQLEELTETGTLLTRTENTDSGLEIIISSVVRF